MTTTCKARQYNDQMLCRCGLAWDVNDPEPPACPCEEQQPCNSISSTQPALSTGSRPVTAQPAFCNPPSNDVSSRMVSYRTDPSGRRLRIAMDLLKQANRYVGQSSSIRARDLSQEICEFIAENPSC